MQKEKQHIDLERLDKLCKGDQVKKVKYLNQFLEIVAPNFVNLKKAFKANDLSDFRKTLHFITPNLVFFGLKDFSQLLGNIENEADLLSPKPVNKTIRESMIEIEKAVSEVEQLIDSMTKNDLNED